jgi:hypothetical protein
LELEIDMKSDVPLPVYYHVPKNAGTYVTNMSLLYFRGFRRNYTDWNGRGYETIKNVEIIDEHNNTLARLITGDPDNMCVSDVLMSNNDVDASHHRVMLSDLTSSCIHRLKLFILIIEDHGFSMGEHICNMVRNNRPYQEYVSIREPFSRTVSWYSYITSEASSHEPLHQYVTTSFENYIKSDIFESNWLMRKLIGVLDTEDFTDKHYEQAINRLNNFEVYRIKDTDKMIDTMFKTCYNLTRDDFPPGMLPPQRNQNPVKDRICFENLPMDIQQTYTEKTFWDKKLWDMYS